MSENMMSERPRRGWGAPRESDMAALKVSTGAEHHFRRLDRRLAKANRGTGTWSGPCLWMVARLDERSRPSRRRPNINRTQKMEIAMSTAFAPLKKIAARDLFDKRLEAFGVREHVMPDKTTEKKRCLTDGRNYLWVSVNDEGLVAYISRYGGNAPGKILSAIAEAFDTDIVSEYQPQYWGFSTQEQWDAAEEEMSRQSRERFYVDLVRYVRAERNGIRPGTIGMIQAEIAKRLANEDPTFLLLENKDKFLDKIDSIYKRDHAIVVTLSEEDIAFARMIVTHEEDLPSA